MEKGSVERAWASYEEAVAYSGLSRTTLWKICSAPDTVLTARVGRRVLINLESLDDYLRSLSRGSLGRSEPPTE